VCGQVLPAVRHSRNHAYYIPRKLVKMFFRADYGMKNKSKRMLRTMLHQQADAAKTMLSEQSSTPSKGGGLQFSGSLLLFF
jgi:hypothetical protein